MTTERDPRTRTVLSWLREDAHENAERVLLRALDEVDATQQRRSWWPARRTSPLNTFTKLAIGAAAVAAVVLIGANLVPRMPSFGSDAPTPVASPSPSTTPSPAPRATASPPPAAFPAGPLAAGSYATQPFAGPGGLCLGQAGCTEAGTEDDSIRVTLTVPDGWAGFEGRAVVRSVERYSPPDGASLMFHRGGWLYTVAPICGGSGPADPTGPTIPTGTTVDEFVTALVDHPDLDVTSPSDVTLGGYSGKYLELRAPENTTTDELGPDPSGCNYYFVWEPGIYAQGPNALWQIWVLDVDGTRAVVRADSFPGTPPGVQSELSAMVGSIEITR
jgi:hypothetical protein